MGEQVSPKACGHTKGRTVVSREEAVMRIRAAVDARREAGSDIVIVARSDARQAVSIEEALWRVQAFADAGADVLFIDALASQDEMRAFCKVEPGVPKMVSFLLGALFLSYTSANYVHVCTSTHSTLLLKFPCHGFSL